MAFDTEGIRQSVDLVSVVGARVPLTPRGHEFVGLCPFHEEQTKSFYVIPDKGFAHCFGCGWNGDAIAFLMDCDGLDFKTACAALQGTDWQAVPMRCGQVKRAPRREWRSEIPPATCQAPETFATSSLGEPVAVWTYRDAHGDLLGYVCRYNVTRDGETRKVILQWTYGTFDDGGPLAWDCKHWTRPRPLFGLDQLAAKPSANVVIVEGEKAAEAAQRLFPASVAVTWPGGCQAVQYADWTPLYGRTVIAIPDADEPGRKAVRYILALLSANKCVVKWVEPEPSRPKGWDLADAVADHWTNGVAVQWAKDNLREYVPDAPAAQPAPARPLPASQTGELAPPAPTEPDQVEDVPPAFSDDAMACLVAKTYGMDWKYVPAFNVWYQWGGSSWREDKKNAVKTLVKNICRKVVNYEQGALLNDAQKRSLTSHRSHTAIYNVLTYTPTFVTAPDQWDKNPWLLAVPEGAVDLKTGEIRHARREDYLTQCTGVSPVGECPHWLTFLDRVTDHQEELQAYLQRLCGYFLTGSNNEQMLAFCYGTGANGKSVFVDTIRAVMGEYATVANAEMFMESKQDRHPTEVADLKNARMVVAQETGEARRWDEAKIKDFTSARVLKARFMRGNFFTYEPTFKLLFTGNYKPALRSVDPAIRRRVHIIPFVVTIPEGERDPYLSEKLKVEHGGILRWMLTGCRLWQEQGLQTPELVRAATDAYLESEDAIGSWLEDNCILDPSQTTPAGTMYRNYVEYCEANKEHPWSQRRLIQNLHARGVESCRAMQVRCWSGIGLQLQPSVREW